MEMIANSFTISEIISEIKSRMQGKSLPEGAQIGFGQLRYLKMLHYTPSGEIKEGEMVVSKDIAEDVVAIFKELFEAEYPIERMQLIDDYAADDGKSMSANNTTAFCYREISGGGKLSKHALGIAIDLNPLYNPYVKGGKVEPEAGLPYVNRRQKFAMKITKNDLAYKVFTRHGFKWGGNWKSLKDYQHFEK